jgi:hypothetical protein
MANYSGEDSGRWVEITGSWFDSYLHRSARPCKQANLEWAVFDSTFRLERLRPSRLSGTRDGLARVLELNVIGPSLTRG